MITQKEWEREVRDVYKKIKSHKKPYFVVVNKLKICIFPNVFSPAYFTDSRWFAENVPKIVGRHSFLEIGTGTGIVALFAALNGAKVSATDISPDAVKNANYNFQKHNARVKTYCGDMYESLPRNARFEFIFWNHPFNLGDNPNEEMLLKAGFDFQYESLEKYISEAHLHLTQKGRLLLGTSNYASLPDIKKIAAKYGYRTKILKKIKIFLTKGGIKNEYRIYELL